MQDMYDLKCKNIIIIDDYELQFPLLSVFDRKNIDRGELAQLGATFYAQKRCFWVFFDI